MAPEMSEALHVVVTSSMEIRCTRHKLEGAIRDNTDALAQVLTKELGANSPSACAALM